MMQATTKSERIQRLHPAGSLLHFLAPPKTLLGKGRKKQDTTTRAYSQLKADQGSGSRQASNIQKHGVCAWIKADQGQ